MALRPAGHPGQLERAFSIWRIDRSDSPNEAVPCSLSSAGEWVPAAVSPGFRIRRGPLLSTTHAEGWLKSRSRVAAFAKLADFSAGQESAYSPGSKCMNGTSPAQG